MPTHRARLALTGLAAVLLLTACGGDEEAGAPEQDALTVAVVGQDNLTWDAEELTADAGTITVMLTCEGGVNHNFALDGIDEEVAACAPGETVEATVDLDAGEYEYICTVPGHESTMRGTLTID